MDRFRRLQDHRDVELVSCLRSALQHHPDAELLVGTDSQSRGDHTIYTSAVVLRFRRNGAQVFYRRERSTRIADLWTRLWGEVERSLEVAQWLSRSELRVARIDLDLNSDPRHGSHKLHHAAVGYVRSHGYEPITKPDMLIAGWAADLLCHGGGRKHETPTGLSPRQG